MEENSTSWQWPVRIWHSLIRSCLPQPSYFEFRLARIQYLPAHEKDQIQDFHNWVQNDPKISTRSAPESPVVGLIENSTANLPNIDMPRTSNEPNPEAPKLTPAATEGTSSAVGTNSGRAEGSRDPAVRVVPIQSMAQSTQEELGKELFDDPLLSIDNVKKLADYMQWSFKYTEAWVIWYRRINTNYSSDQIECSHGVIFIVDQLGWIPSVYPNRKTAKISINYSSKRVVCPNQGLE